MAKVSSAARQPQPMDVVEAQVREYKYLKEQIDLLSKRQKQIRDELMILVEQTGYEDDQGHLWVEFDEDIDGVGALQRQRRVSRSLDEESAEKILTDAGVWDKCTELKRVVNEDAVMQALYDEELTEVDVDGVYPPKITWALVLK